jgi:tRNA C32,U32 (ribose-2'-O)-methylase TrmJ
MPLPAFRLASPTDMGYLYRHIDRYLDIIHHPVFKRENTMILIRRILGRANLTTREASTLHGLLRRSEWHIDPSLLDRDKTGSRNLYNHEVKDEEDLS